MLISILQAFSLLFLVTFSRVSGLCLYNLDFSLMCSFQESVNFLFLFGIPPLVGF
nr:MAG TPA: hypothetical protein [Caudoviricetes sp.]